MIVLGASKMMEASVRMHRIMYDSQNAYKGGHNT